MLCLQAFLFLIELRHPATVSMMTWVRGVGQAQFPFQMVEGVSMMGQLFSEIQREAIGSWHTQSFILGFFRFKGHQAMFFFKTVCLFLSSFYFLAKWT